MQSITAIKKVQIRRRWTTEYPHRQKNIITRCRKSTSRDRSRGIEYDRISESDARPASLARRGGFVFDRRTNEYCNVFLASKISPPTINILAIADFFQNHESLYCK